MPLSYEEALFYKILLQNGFTKEVNKWIDNIAINSETLEGIYLDLVCNQNNLNNLISCLHKYTLDKKFDEKTVCEKLRLYIKDKLNSKEISIEQAANYLYSFAYGTENMYNYPWYNFYLVGLLNDYLSEGFLDKDEYHKVINDFLETGKEINFNILSFGKNIKPKNRYTVLLLIIILLLALITIIILSN